MPELPEVETIVRQLRGRLPGLVVSGVRLLRASYVRCGRGLLHKLEGQSVTAVRRLGKAVVIEFSGSRCMIVRLGMTGSLLLDEQGDSPPHCHLVLHFGPRLCLRFVDPRRFGGVYLRAACFLPRAPEVCRLGLDPLAGDFTDSWLWHRLARSKRNLKSFLLDQTIIAGVGNIYASEILFRAGLHPLRRADSLRREQARRLRRETVNVLRAAIDSRGTTFSDYKDSAGRSGDFAPLLLVYGREGQNCYKCGARIRRLVISGRSTFFCPRCQRAPRGGPVEGRPKRGARRLSDRGSKSPRASRDRP